MDFEVMVSNWSMGARFEAIAEGVCVLYSLLKIHEYSFYIAEKVVNNQIK